MEETEKVKLNLACGEDYREGYVNIDDCSMFPDCRVNKSADILTLDWELGSVDEILVLHFIMYTRPEELLPLLIKWRSWLKEGGKLIIETINLREVLEHQSDEKLLIPLFGKPNTAPHRWAWSINSVVDLLDSVGFSETKPVAGEKNHIRDFRIIATK